MDKPMLELDAAALKALAHPVRVKIMQILSLHDRASVTGLAGELNESTSSVSYHLRQLAEHGLVRRADDGGEADPARPTVGGRRRGRPQAYWRRAADQIHLAAFEFLADDDTRDAAKLFLREYEADRSRRLAHWFATADQWPEQWQRASSDADSVLLLSADEARALADEIAAVIKSHRERASELTARPVTVQYAIFPAAVDDHVGDGTRRGPKGGCGDAGATR